MRSIEPDPLNPWPHDMMITVETAPSTLTFLLFVRAAWHIEGTDLPAVEPVPLVGDSRRPVGSDSRQLLDKWNAAWSEAVADHAPQRTPHPVDSATKARLDAMSVEELLAIDDPRQSSTFGAGVDLEALGEWAWSAESRVHHGGFDEQPERVNLAELVPAWRHGLRTITQLPFAEDWARRISSTHLLVAARTRSDRTTFGRALCLPVEPPR